MVRVIRVAVALISVLVLVLDLIQECKASNLTRADFPADFVFGSGTSAYQVEGAAFEDGRMPSIYDNYAHSGHFGNDNGDVACDEYHKYKEDVKLMVDTGLEAYRFSIAWPRLIPNGRGAVNPKAIEYYNNLINELISNGIEPHVVLLHWDLPQALQDEYGGWLSRNVVKDFTAYADVCFREFGDRVSHWTTMNEPNWMVFFCVNSSLGSCTSTRDPYLSAHNLLLGHASAVRVYRTKYQEKQGGYIGFNVYAGWFVPETATEEDVLAAQRASDFVVGWFMNPLVYGDYPSIMKKVAGNRLPSFTEHESKLVKGSYDFIAVNCYTAFSIKNRPNHLDINQRSYITDVAVATKILEVGGQIVQRVLEHFKQEYGNPPMYIHENGYRTDHNASLNDTSRIEYLDACIGSLLDAVRNGSNTKGYFVWSFMDLFELDKGFKWGFGLYYVDFNDSERKRYPKLSAHWYSSFLKGDSSNSSEMLQQVSHSPSGSNRFLVNSL